MARLLLVTGGGRGIGAATCRLAAAAGYDLAINYQRDATAAEALAEACRAAGVRPEAILGDMAREDDVAPLIT